MSFEITDKSKFAWQTLSTLQLVQPKISLVQAYVEAGCK